MNVCWFLAWLIWLWRQKHHVLPKRRLTFKGLHGVISHKIKPFITTSVRTASPTYYMIHYCFLYGITNSKIHVMIFIFLTIWTPSSRVWLLVYPNMTRSIWREISYRNINFTLGPRHKAEGGGNLQLPDL
jgi:hypothetical protein